MYYLERYGKRIPDPKTGSEEWRDLRDIYAHIRSLGLDITNGVMCFYDMADMDNPFYVYVVNEKKKR